LAQQNPLGWLYVITLLLLLVAQGRSYYLAPAYAMLLAAGAVVIERWLAVCGALHPRVGWASIWAAVAVALAVGGALSLPVAPVGSGLWNVTSAVHDNFVEEIGWPELVEAVAGVYSALPADARPGTAILAGNYGEAGAINLYGPAYGLPPVISGVNSYGLRGAPEPPPQTVIVLGYRRAEVESFFASCTLAAQVSNRLGVKNEETRHPDVFVCRDPVQPWPTLWRMLRRFG
jgi:hypothetical protein